MMIPQLHGKLDQKDRFIFVACDTDYFLEFGRSIINSIKTNSSYGIHVHLYNPTQDQINFCSSCDRVSLTYEFAPLDLFKASADKWATTPINPIAKHNYDRIITAMSKSNDKSIQERMQRTFFACARFIRFADLIQPETVAFAIDIDAIVRKDIPQLSNSYDFYIHHITGKKARFLAGGIFLPGTIQGYNFLQDYKKSLITAIEEDNIHWGLDQDVLDGIVPKYNFGNLPMQYIDWNMHPDSYIWTAKGKRKELEIFINEQKKYSV